MDITDLTKIKFEHKSDPEAKFIAESMSGGVALIDYDGDGWPDIYFTNAQSVDMALHGVRSRSALFHNNHDGTFTDVTDKAGVGYPCWAMGAAVVRLQQRRRPDLLVTCLNGVVLYRNNGDGTFTDVTKAAKLDADAGWATGAWAFGDYDSEWICRSVRLCNLWTFISTICLLLVLQKLASTWASMFSADRAV